ncbi:hypothetical protein CLI84_01150 [Porphyromonas gingivalis]|nr:hypothetical protein CLI84_01150 [Porphyromonas gingivalis]
MDCRGRCFSAIVCRLLSFSSDTLRSGVVFRANKVSLYERILWSPMRGYYGLIREDTMVSYERILWSHTRGYYGLL